MYAHVYMCGVTWKVFFLVIDILKDFFFFSFKGFFFFFILVYTHICSLIIKGTEGSLNKIG